MSFPRRMRASIRTSSTRLPRWLAAAFTLAVATPPTVALAVPGPDSVAVVASSRSAESVALAERYATARQLPPGRVCALDLPETDDIDLATFRASLADPLRACLGEALPHIEAIVLVRGVPLRVDIGAADGCGRTSLAAALGAWDSTTPDGDPVLGRAPGTTITCSGGAPCCAAAWGNPFRTGVFEPGWSRDTGDAVWRPLLVTMLDGRSYEDAARLIDSAVAAEMPGATRGQLLFMNGADPARGSLDPSYDGVISALRDRGITDVERVPFQSDLTGRTLGAFFVGTASLGTTIEGNDFTPGALVDNLTSFGAVPQNFAPMGESQVSIARWVARGVAGVHGTTDEPLANCFPARRLLVDYVDGGTLAEAYLRNMPFVYWQNLVLGDPMAAPYATRPVVRVEGATDGETIAGSRRVVVSAEDPAARGPLTIRLFLDGSPVAESLDGSPIDHCLTGSGEISLLAVAQAFDDGTDRGLHRPKGWTSLGLTVGPGDPGCAAGSSDAGIASDSGASRPDASIRDAGATTDAGGPPTDAAEAPPDVSGFEDGSPAARSDDGGCGCSVPSGAAPRWLGVLLFAAVLGAFLRARARRSDRAR